jgi:hypothetical protein
MSPWYSCGLFSIVFIIVWWIYMTTYNAGVSILLTTLFCGNMWML